MKKSENVEIRIDHATKQALQDKAEVEQRSVSEVLRSLIDDYLGGPEKVRQPKFRHYGGWATAAVVLMFSGLSLIPAASADNLKLDFKGEIVTPEGDGQRLRTIDSVFEFDAEGGTVNLPMGASETIFEVTVNAITLDDDSAAADIRIKIIEIDGPERTVLAQPHVIGRLDEVARIEIGSEQGTTYKINLVPSEAD